jgi:cell division protein FtsB
MAPESEANGTEGRLARLVAFASTVYTGRRKVATGAAALVVLGLAYHVIFGANGLTVYQQKRQETQLLNSQLERLQRENEHLKEHVERLQNDSSAVEHQAREELHYTRPGEVIYTLPSQPKEAGAANPRNRGAAGSPNEGLPAGR